jgi:hypothetical protein
MPDRGDGIMSLRVCVLASEAITDWDGHAHGNHSYRKAPRVLSVAATSLFYDPRLIAALGCVPDVVELRAGGDAAVARTADLIVVPQALEPAREALVLEAIEHGARVFWVRPSAEALDRASGGRLCLKDTLRSHAPRWELGDFNATYPYAYSYDCYEMKGAVEPAHRLGPWPSCYRTETCVFCAASWFHAYAHTWNTPADLLPAEGFGNAFQSVYLSELLSLLGKPQPLERLRSRYFLRRDFHAYGYTRLMVHDLAVLHDRTPVFSEADRALGRAATALAEEASDSQVEALLKPAFQALYEERRKILDIPVYYADAMHGGIFTREYGYIEIASPQFVTDLLAMFLELARRRGYRFSVDVSIATFSNLERHCPDLIHSLREAMDDGIFEVANGSIGQPFAHLFGLESNIRQFVTGQAEMQRLFGQRARTFLAQEMQLGPVYPTILAQAGFDLALHRVQNTGATVYDDRVCVNWRAPDGSGMKTIPTHYDDSQQSISTGFIFWPELITVAARHYPMAIFTNLLDLVWITSFREETIRASYYAPVMGSFVTYRDLAGLLEPEGDVVYSRNDYRLQLLTGASVAQSDMHAAARQLEAFEMFAALSGNAAADEAIEKAWAVVGAYQNHDNSACHDVPPAGRSGPFLLDVLKADVDEGLSVCRRLLGESAVLFNPLACERRVMVYRSGDGVGSLKTLPRLDQVEVVGEVGLDALGTAEMPDAVLSVNRSRDRVLNNGLLNVVQDPASGALVSIYDIERSVELLAGPGNHIAAGMNGYARAIGCEKLSGNGVEQFCCRAELYFSDHTFAGWAETTVTLPERSRRLYFRTALTPHGLQKVHYRHYTDERRQSVAAVFDLDPRFQSVHDCWFNRIHEPCDETGKVFCPGIYFGDRDLERRYLETPPRVKTQSYMGVVARGAEAAVLLHNDGAQIYEIDGARIANLLWSPNDYGTVFSYALEVLSPESNPFDAMLDYQYDPIFMPRADLAPALRVDSGLWLSSLRRRGKHWYVRVVETAGKDVSRACLRAPFSIESAAQVDLLDEERNVLPVEEDGRVAFSIGPNGVVTIRLCASATR